MILRRTANLLTSVIVGATATSFLAACGDDELFRAPERTATVHAPPSPSDSILTMSTLITYADLQQAIIDKTSTPIRLQGSERLFCADIPRLDPGRISSRRECIDVPYADFRGIGMQRQCINVPEIIGPSIGMSTQCSNFNWQATIARQGSPTVRRTGNATSVELPIRVDGQGGLSGDLPRLLSLSAKNFEADLVPGVALTVALDDRWCPVIRATPTRRWVSSASVEIVGRSCIGIDLGPLGRPEVCVGPASIDLTNQAEAAVNQSQSDLVRAIQTALSCDQIRNTVAPQWRPFSIPLLNGTEQPAFFNIVPTGAAFSGLVPEDAGIRLAVQMRATTQLATTAVQPNLMPLPTLSTIQANESRATLNVPAIIPYHLLSQLLRDNLKGRSFTQELDIGGITVRVEDVIVYPSGGSLAIGLKINATTPSRWLNTEGWVYLTGQPDIGSGGRSVAIRNLNYAVALDSRFWEIAADLFNSSILQEINKHSSMDISEMLTQAEEQVKAAVNAQQVPGVRLAVKAADIRAESVGVYQDGVVATARLDMTFDLELTGAVLLGR